MASGGGDKTIRDGVASDSSVVVPDWKRELIERRKSLANHKSSSPGEFNYNFNVNTGGEITT